MSLRMVLQIVAVLEIVGGALGLLGVLVSLVWSGLASNAIVSAAIGITFFLLAIFAGAMLWRNRASGYFASVAVQLPQLIKIATPQFAFLLCLGGDLAVLQTTQTDPEGRAIRTLRFNSQGGSFSIVETSRPEGAPLLFGISLVPCVVLAFLRKGWRFSDERAAPSREAIPANAKRLDCQPDWVVPFWLKVVVGLFALVMVCCAGVLALTWGQ